MQARHAPADIALQSGRLGVNDLESPRLGQHEERRQRHARRVTRWSCAVLGCQCGYIACFVAARPFEPGTSEHHVLNSMTVVFFLVGVAAVRGLFRRNTSVSVLKALWRRPPVIVCMLNTLAVLGIEVYLAAAHTTERTWWGVPQAAALSTSVAVVISSDAILVLPEPRIRAAYSLLLMGALASLVFERTVAILPSEQDVLMPVSAAIETTGAAAGGLGGLTGGGVNGSDSAFAEKRQDLTVQEVLRSVHLSTLMVMVSGTFHILRRPGGMAFIALHATLGSYRSGLKDKQRQRVTRKARGGGAERFDDPSHRGSVLPELTMGRLPSLAPYLRRRRSSNVSVSVGSRSGKEEPSRGAGLQRETSTSSAASAAHVGVGDAPDPVGIPV